MDKTEIILLNLIEVYEKRDLLNKLLKNKRLIDNYSISEIHCIDLIGKIQYPNVTILAKSLNMTKGAISKITKKLIDNGLIKKYQKSNNKKEVYFQLTNKGQEIYNKHEILHNKSKEKYKTIINTFNDKDKDVLINFLKTINKYFEDEIKELI